MKRWNSLYEKIYSMENLLLADVNARKSKTNSKGVKIHDRNREKNIRNLYQILKNKIYKTSKYKVLDIFDSKPRKIFILPYFPDRITHHAIMQIIEPIFMSSFTKDTYSCIKERGIHGVVKELKLALQDEENTKFCLKLDIKKFYPSINHDVLKKLFRNKFKDLDLLNLLDEIVNSAPGNPIGNYSSQIFANFYLSYFDHWIKENKFVNYYFRYCDDVVILGSNKEELHKLLKEIVNYLDNNLMLTVKENHQIFPVGIRGIDFVGYVFFHTHILLRKTIKQNFARMIIKNKNEKSLASYKGWTDHCNSINLVRKLLNENKLENISLAA